MGQTFDLSNIFDVAAQMQGTTADSMKAELYEDLQYELEDLQNEVGVRLDTGKIMNLVNTALKGAWSPLDLLGMMGALKTVISPIVSAANLAAGLYAGEELAAVTTASSYLNTAYIVLLILVILTLVLALVAIVCALTDHKGGMIPYMVFALIMLILFIVMVVSANSNSAEAMSLLEMNAAQGSVSMRICVGAILCAVFAVLAFVAMFLPIGAKAGAVAAPVSRAASGWKCPTCGTMLRGDQKFCLTCGTKQPEQPVRAVAPAARPAAAPKGWKCPGCGAELKLEQKFCPNCGTRQPLQQPAQPAAPVARPATVSGWKCPGCGAIVKTEQKYCPNCGTRQPLQQPAQPETPAAPEPKRCSVCGNVLADGMSFCPKCGTPASEPAQAPAYTSVHAAPAAEPKPDLFSVGTELLSEEPTVIETPGYKPADNGEHGTF
jgi:uncharacterized OB-fold protein